MKSFYKLLSLVLTLTMMVSLVAMPSALAAVYYVGDTSAYKIEAKFVDASGADITSVATGETVYVALALKSFSTLQMGYADITLEGASFKTETNKLVSDIFMRDTDTSVFSPGLKTATYGIVYQSTSLMTSTNGKAKYYAFPTETDIPLALYEVTVDGGATEVSVSITGQNFKVGDAKGATNKLATAETTVIATEGDTLTLGLGGGDIPDVPVITYSYSAAWKDVSTAAKVFPEGTEDADVKGAVVVTKVTTTDGVADGGVVMTEGYTVALNNGNVTVTIDADPSAVVAGNLTYTIAEHVPVITYSYSAAWKDVSTAAKVFPEGTEDADVKEAVVVTKVTTTDGVADDGVVMTEGYTVALNNGNVTVTIDADPSAVVAGNLTYTIEEHVPEVSYRYEATWTAENAFDHGTSVAAILSKVEVKKYTTTDGVEDDGVVITTGFDATAEDGVVTITIDGVEPITLVYTTIDKVEYKNVVLNADGEYEYDLDKNEIAALVTVTVEKWVNGNKVETITLEEGKDYSLAITFNDNDNKGSINVELIGDYDGVTNPQSVVFERSNPTITFSDVTAALSQTEFPESVDEATIIAEVSANAMKKVGNLQAEAYNLIKGEDYSVSVDLEAEQVTIVFAPIFETETIVLDFTITPAVITYENPSAVLSNDVFGAIPEAADIIARLTVTADKLKDGVADGSVEITSENYDVEIGEGIATITFKNVYATLEPVTVDFTVEEVTYGAPVITVDGTISADGKSEEDIIAEAWTLITATREVLTNGEVTGSEDLDKDALEELGVTVSYADGKVEFVLGGDVVAEISVSAGILQFSSADPRTAHNEFIKFAAATLKDIFDNIKIKKNVFQIIELNADEWETLTEAVANGDATVTVDGETYDNTNIDGASFVVVGDADKKSLEITYKDVEQDVEVTLLEVPSDYANEEGEAPVVSITTDATEVQTGTDVLATVYVSDLIGDIDTGKVTLLFSNADVTEDDIVAADGFVILSKSVSGNEISVVFTIDDAHDAGAGIFKVTLDTTASDVNAKLGLAIKDYVLERIVEDDNAIKPVNVSIGDNAEVTVTAGDVFGYDYDVSYASGKTAFYTDAEAAADVKVLAYTTTNGVRDENQTPVDVSAQASINANNGVITVDKDGVRVTTLTYTIYEAAFDQVVAIETLGSVNDTKFTDNVTVKLNDAAFSGATVALDGRNIKVSVAGIKAEGTYEIAVAVPGYTKATINVTVSKKATGDGYDAPVVTGSKIYAGDINDDNRIDAVDFSDVAGKYGQAKETKYDLYIGNDSTTIDNLDVTTMAHYFIELARGLVSADGTTITPNSGN